MTTDARWCAPASRRRASTSATRTRRRGGRRRATPLRSPRQRPHAITSLRRSSKAYGWHMVRTRLNTMSRPALACLFVAGNLTLRLVVTTCAHSGHDHAPNAGGHCNGWQEAQGIRRVAASGRRCYKAAAVLEWRDDCRHASAVASDGRRRRQRIRQAQVACDTQGVLQDDGRPAELQDVAARTRGSCGASTHCL